jgi:hypothetical protein
MNVKNLLYRYKLLKAPELSIKPRKVVRNTKSDLFNVFANDEEKNQDKINDF